MEVIHLYYVSKWKMEMKDGYICTDNHGFIEHNVKFNFYENALIYVNANIEELLSKNYREIKPFDSSDIKCMKLMRHFSNGNEHICVMIIERDWA